MDNNGSVRLVVIQNSTGFDTLHYDYKPFGDTLWTSAGTMNRDNFDGSTYDSEFDLQMLGFRMYDNETGRFTTPDLLWSAFPAQTPYHYAYNSPLTYRDPSGLAPEKEKEGEELLWLEIDWEYIYGICDAINWENYRRSRQRLTNADNSPMEYSEYNFGDRTGNSASYGFGYSYWTDGYNFERSYYINNHEGSFSYDEWGTNEYGFDVVRGRNVNLTTADGVDPGKWLDGAQNFLDGYSMFDQGPGGAIASVLSAIIDLYKGDYFSAGMGLLAAVPIAGIIGDAYKAGKLVKNAERTLDAIDKVKDIENKVHGNSLLSERATWGYKLFSNDGTFLKNGITSCGIPENRYTKYFMSDKNMPILYEFPNRYEAWKWERQENLLNPGPLNKERYIRRK